MDSALMRYVWLIPQNRLTPESVRRMLLSQMWLAGVKPPPPAPPPCAREGSRKPQGQERAVYL
jgi:hypothetical protein